MHVHGFVAFVWLAAAGRQSGRFRTGQNAASVLGYAALRFFDCPCRHGLSGVRQAQSLAAGLIWIYDLAHALARRMFVCPTGMGLFLLHGAGERKCQDSFGYDNGRSCSVRHS